MPLPALQLGVAEAHRGGLTPVPARRAVSGAPARRGRAAGVLLAGLAGLAGLTWGGTAMAFSDRRLIVAFGDPASSVMERLKSLVDGERCRLVERDVDVRYVDVAELRAPRDEGLERLARLRDPAAGPFELVLVGKDGGVKARAADPEALPGFLDTIDGMPMRRAEMRREDGAAVRCGPDPAPAPDE